MAAAAAWGQALATDNVVDMATSTENVIPHRARVREARPLWRRVKIAPNRLTEHPRI